MLFPCISYHKVTDDSVKRKWSWGCLMMNKIRKNFHVSININSPPVSIYLNEAQARLWLKLYNVIIITVFCCFFHCSSHRNCIHFALLIPYSLSSLIFFSFCSIPTACPPISSSAGSVQGTVSHLNLRWECANSVSSWLFFEKYATAEQGGILSLPWGKGERSEHEIGKHSLSGKAWDPSNADTEDHFSSWGRGKERAMAAIQNGWSVFIGYGWHGFTGCSARGLTLVLTCTQGSCSSHQGLGCYCVSLSLLLEQSAFMWIIVH